MFLSCMDIMQDVSRFFKTTLLFYPVYVRPLDENYIIPWCPALQRSKLAVLEKELAAAQWARDQLLKEMAFKPCSEIPKKKSPQKKNKK